METDAKYVCLLTDDDLYHVQRLIGMLSDAMNRLFAARKLAPVSELDDLPDLADMAYSELASTLAEGCCHRPDGPP
jgi:hypothetical protein